MNQQQQQQQPFYGPLIHNNPCELVSETVGHINPYYHHNILTHENGHDVNDSVFNIFCSFVHFSRILFMLRVDLQVVDGR